MKIKNASEQRLLETPHGVDVKALYNTPDAVISLITLQPGESLKRHITPVDVAFYVLEGTGIVEIGDESEEVTAECLIESPRDIAHNWHNKSESKLRFLVIKAPKPTRMSIFLD